jgi:aspartate aminotransferase, cytoplasmic
MFSYTGLSEAQSLHLINTHHIHMLKNGRIAMVGLNSKNISYVAEAIHDAVTKLK